MLLKGVGIMFENILFILLIAFIIMGVFMIMRGRMNRSLKYSLKMERKRVPKLSDEDLEKRIKQAEKVHNNKFLNGFIGLFFNKEYAEYKENLMQLYKKELAKRSEFA